MKNDDNSYTVNQAATLLDTTVATIQLWVDSGKLDSWMSGDQIRIDKKSAFGFFNAIETKGNESSKPTRKSVLIVEDDIDLISLYRMRFKQWKLPIDLRLALNGFVGLVEFGKRKPDLLIADLMMPNFDGGRMLSSLEHEGLHTPTIIITGASSNQISELRSRNEDLLILTKPVDFNMLRRLISTILDVRPVDKE